ncbi:hypothetical protein H310_10039 [Aphanomyces invadans]|uniref:HTH psq-type domain-containing protein n=1 Tax=Aphanomyces invadans TaxID=157072 RepID=A0A024TTQ9_9STRA|nr:hypothetical protein H310_10039 [Aphanomyces invadans]ETV96722.1 hypothetical protein H310_10039 [Aphanomyces invadans]|eukprot:XP_008874499.1 hypothetical protein H310_10039 [Aphanomyces invadans]
MLTAKKKLEIVKEYLRDGTSVNFLAKKHEVQGNQIHRWIAAHGKLKEVVARSLSLATIHRGKDVARPDVEDQVLEYYEHLRDNDIAISTKMLILKARKHSTQHFMARNKGSYLVGLPIPPPTLA